MAKQKETVKHNVLHRFVCEHCDEISDWKTSVVEGNTQEDILDSKIPAIQQDVAKNNYSALIGLEGKCNKCGKRQSWELRSAKTIMWRSPLIGLAAAGSLGWVAWFLFGLFGFVVVFVVVALFAFIIGLVDYIRISSDVKTTHRKNTPEINWMDAQSLDKISMEDEIASLHSPTG